MNTQETTRHQQYLDACVFEKMFWESVMMMNLGELKVAGSRACPGQRSRMTSARSNPGRVASGAVNPLERLIQITQANDCLIKELATIRRRFAQAQSYLGDQDSSPRLGRALVAFARKKRDRVLDQLQNNRQEAVAILADLATPH